VAYLSVTAGLPDVVAHALVGYALLQLLVLLRMLPWIRQQPFAASYWGFTFGVTALAIAPLRMIERGDTGPVAVLAPCLFVVANGVIAVLSVATVYLLMRGQLLAPATAVVTAVPQATP
jgi:tellurite resistance protein